MSSPVFEAMLGDRRQMERGGPYKDLLDHVFHVVREMQKPLQQRVIDNDNYIAELEKEVEHWKLLYQRVTDK